MIDTHSHLAMLEHSPLDEILARAAAAGVTKMISVSTDEGSWESNQNLAATHENIFYTVGIHPHDALRWPECAHKFQAFVENSPIRQKCVAVGEIGLDFYYNYSPKEMQIDVFEAQLELAKALELPIVVHCRDSFDELYDLLEKKGLPERGGVMHCFTGNVAQAKRALDIGFWISFSGIVTFKKATELQAAAKTIPQDKILFETDCPYLAPEPYRGKPNEPAFIRKTAEFLASLRGVSLETLVAETTENVARVFAIY